MASPATAPRARRLPRIATALLLLVALATLAAAACSGGGDDEVTATPSATSTVAAATRTPPPSIPAAPTTFDFASDAIAFNYGVEWRVSASTDQSFTLTLKDAPTEALLAITWQPLPADGDLEEEYLRQLTTAGRASEQLTDIDVAGVEAHRYATLIGQESDAIALSILFNSADTAYLVTFTSSPDDFGAQAPLVDAVLATIELP